MIPQQLKEVWSSLTPYQKKLLPVYFVIGLPWIPMSFFAFAISKNKGTKLWVDSIDERRSDMILILSLSVAVSIFSAIIGLFAICLWQTK